MVAPDYVGMGTPGPTPYLIGTGQAYSALDAVRAAHQLSRLSLSEQTVVWGHSQGGNAALWTGKLAATYAPNLKIDGVAALAPATNLVSLANVIEGKTVGNILGAYLVAAYADTYPDIHLNNYVRPGAIAAVDQAAKRCLTDPGLVASVIISATQPKGVFKDDLTTGPLANRLKQNTPTADMAPPLLVAQGTGDEVIPVSITRTWVANQCAAGHKLQFQTYPNLTHMGLVAPNSALTTYLINWTTNRFAGKPPPNNC
jgi:acetyl esterase/lipase